jgi:repressor LexA
VKPEKGHPGAAPSGGVASPGQLETLRLIAAHLKLNGYPPTVRELVADLGIRSTNDVAERLRALVKKGLIRRGARSARAIAITDLGQAALR